MWNVKVSKTLWIDGKVRVSKLFDMWEFEREKNIVD